jgi:tripartite-type tricarboxylate transporter receptor subunit TctC
MIHVPFRGSSQSTAALLGGQIDLVCDGLAPQLGHIREGRVRPLGITTPGALAVPARSLPTIAETLPGYAFPMWVAVFAPAKTPKAIIDKLSACDRRHGEGPDDQEALRRTCWSKPVGSTPQELDRFFAEQLAFNKDVIEKANIRPAE